VYFCEANKKCQQMITGFRSFLFLAMFSLYTLGRGFAQQTGKLEILYSKEVKTERVEQEEVSIYWGDVQLKKDSTFVYADSIRQKGNAFWAFGNLVVQQPDSQILYGDSLYFDDKRDVLFLYGEVVVKKASDVLFTQFLRYDLPTKKANYTGGGLLISKATLLQSKGGIYFTKKDEILFLDSVVVEDPAYTLRADSLLFNPITRVVSFLGPTLIQFEDNTIYCTAGYYQSETGEARFFNKPQYARQGSFATADTMAYATATGEIELLGNAFYREDSLQAKAHKIIYFEKKDKVQLEGKADFKSAELFAFGELLHYDLGAKHFTTQTRATLIREDKKITADFFDVSDLRGEGFVHGSVLFEDEEESTMMWSDSAYFRKTQSYIKTWGGRPLLMNYAGEDTLFMAADTLISFKDSLHSEISDSLYSEPVHNRMVLALKEVRIFREGLQAVCDSLTFSEEKEMFYLDKGPIVWSDSTQISGDSIRLKMVDKVIDQIFVENKVLVVNTLDAIFFSQITGKRAVGQFEQKSIKEMLVKGAVKTVYYIINEEDAYLGVNVQDASRMKVLFDFGKLDEVYFFEKPEGKMLPMRTAPHEEIMLEGFFFEVEKRPYSPYDLRPGLDKGMEAFVFPEK
jgi:lipopolysaccharide export system protein LptA